MLSSHVTMDREDNVMSKSKEQREQEKIVKEMLGKHPIVDAKTAFKFIVREDDNKNAVQKDPQNCAIARVIERITGIKQGIAVFPTIVYLPWDVKGDGNFRIERYSLHKETRDAIKEFDR